MARVLMFGRLQDLAGWREQAVPAPTLSSLRDRLSADDPALGRALIDPGVITVVNQAVVRDDRPLDPADEVAFAPPVSGG